MAAIENIGSSTATTTAVDGDVITRLITPQDKMMEHRAKLWQETLDGLYNYRYKFGDTVQGKELSQKKIGKVNSLFSDVVRYELGLKHDDKEAIVLDEPYTDAVEYRRKVLEKKRITNPAGEPMHIYQDHNQEFHFVDECRNGGIGIGLEELKHFVTNYKQYCDVNKHAYVPAYLCIFGYKIPINIPDEDIVEKDIPSEEEMTKAYVQTLKKTQTLITDFFKRYPDMEPTK